MSEADEETARIRRVASLIERYVAAHPNASDTIEGIHRWWLVNASFEEDAALLELALEQLVDRGVMTRRTLPDGQTVFSGRAAGARPGRGGPPRSGEENR